MQSHTPRRQTLWRPTDKSVELNVREHGTNYLQLSEIQVANYTHTLAGTFTYISGFQELENISLITVHHQKLRAPKILQK